ncbi:hypothetical protein [Actinoplanes sp. NPDC051411]|uniref:hypothetical protein n=1 Tax=Actinoplanes sp. NPDC051411 TaxID=3155522 RepID=UPI003419DE58
MAPLAARWGALVALGVLVAWCAGRVGSPPARRPSGALVAWARWPPAGVRWSPWGCWSPGVLVAWARRPPVTSTEVVYDLVF